MSLICWTFLKQKGIVICIGGKSINVYTIQKHCRHKCFIYILMENEKNLIVIITMNFQFGVYIIEKHVSDFHQNRMKTMRLKFYSSRQLLHNNEGISFML